jgi:hypothetical protein
MAATYNLALNATDRQQAVIEAVVAQHNVDTGEALTVPQYLRAVLVEHLRNKVRAADAQDTNRLLEAYGAASDVTRATVNAQLGI